MNCLAGPLRRRFPLAATLLAALLLALAPTFARTALAHPLGNFTTNRYARIEVYQDRALIHYVVDMAEIPTFQAMSSIDTDNDGAASPEELAAYAETSAATIAGNFALTANSRPVTARAIDRQAQLLPGQGGLDVLRIAIVYEAPLAVAPGSNTTLSFRDENFRGTQGWKEVVIRGSEGAQLTVDPGLTVDQSDALRAYAAETLRSAPNVSEASFIWVAGTGSPAPAPATASLAEARDSASGFAGIFADLSDGNVTLGFLLLSLLIAFAFGTQHALGPGHGKTMVAAYLVGSRGTPKHAVALGLTVTATHTSTVYLLGLVTLVAAAYITPETVYLWMGVAAGAMVIAFGAALLVQRALQYRRASIHDSRFAIHDSAGHRHRHGVFGKPHTHSAEPHVHDSVGRNRDAARPHVHEHDAEPVPGSGADGGGSRVTWRSLLSLGVLGGLLPCPSAVVVMVAAISQGQVLLGMLLIVAFSLGLAGVLVAIGLSLVLGRRVPARHRRLLEHPVAARAVAAMPVLSAAVVTLVGIGLTYQAVARV